MSRTVADVIVETLERAGKLHILREPEQIRDLNLRKAAGRDRKVSDKRTTRDFLCQQILNFCHQHSGA